MTIKDFVKLCEQYGLMIKEDDTNLLGNRCKCFHGYFLHKNKKYYLCTYREYLLKYEDFMRIELKNQFAIYENYSEIKNRCTQNFDEANKWLQEEIKKIKIFKKNKLLSDLNKDFI